MPSSPPLDAAPWITAVIHDFVAHSPENSLGNGTGEKSWDTPLTGFSGGDDPLYEEFKAHVGPFHWTPREAFALAFPHLDINAADLTVISWILPQTAQSKGDNGKETLYPAERWARSRLYGENFNEALRRHVVTTLQEAGYAAVAPTLLAQWAAMPSDRYGDASKWSERHAAYASGLGTFGLSDGLITPLGKAMRVGTVVARIKIPPTERPYRTHQEYCLYFTRGTCGKCIQRCPVNSITPAGRDKGACRRQLRKMAEHVKTTYGFEGYGCGLCQTAVPCASGIPVSSG